MQVYQYQSDTPFLLLLATRRKFTEPSLDFSFTRT